VPEVIYNKDYYPQAEASFIWAGIGGDPTDPTDQTIILFGTFQGIPLPGAPPQYAAVYELFSPGPPRTQPVELSTLAPCQKGGLEGPTVPCTVKAYDQISGIVACVVLADGNCSRPLCGALA
jgi:hypothetical protein